MKQEIKVIIGIVLATIIIIGGATYLAGKNAARENMPADQEKLVRADSPTTKALPVKVVVVEFGDFQCPACGAAFPTVEKVMDHYKNDADVSFIFRNFPLSQHKNAKPSAYAALSAKNQGKFWEMVKELYENQSEWSEEGDAQIFFDAYAKKLGLDKNKFDQDMAGENIRDFVERDLGDAVSLKIDQTPTFFVNGIKVKNFPSYEGWISLIEDQKTTAGKQLAE